MTETLPQCDVCTPLGFNNHQKPDEAAVFIEAFKQWLCAHCLEERVADLDGVVSGLPDNAYHGDRTSLSSSGARTLLWQAPARFRAEQQERPDPKPEYDFGHVAHKLILGVGEEIVEVDATSWQTKAASDTRREAWAQGKIPILTKHMETAQLMAKRVHEHPLAAALLSTGDPEVSGFYRDPLTGVRLRWRADWLHPGRSRIICVDYKTTKDASPRGFHKSIGEYRYHQQDAWYRDGLIANEVDDDPLFLFIAQEKVPPYLVSVHECRDWQLQRGRALNRNAIDRYAHCLETNDWPGYGDGIHTVDLPTYINYREEEMLA